MESKTAVTIIYLGLALFGFLMLAEAIKGMRRGEYRYRHSWFHKGEDGFGFWIVTGSMAVIGLFVIVVSFWTWTTRILAR
jgi:hypothetical protein